MSCLRRFAAKAALALRGDDKITNPWCDVTVVTPSWWFDLPAVDKVTTRKKRDPLYGVMRWADVPAESRLVIERRQDAPPRCIAGALTYERTKIVDDRLVLQIAQCSKSSLPGLSFCRYHALAYKMHGWLTWDVLRKIMDSRCALPARYDLALYEPVLLWESVPDEFRQTGRGGKPRWWHPSHSCSAAILSGGFVQCARYPRQEHRFCNDHLQRAYSLGITTWKKYVEANREIFDAPAPSPCDHARLAAEGVTTCPVCLKSQPLHHVAMD